MKTIVYVDGFNLYYSLLKENPQLKWLHIKHLSVNLLGPTFTITSVKYFTARVHGKFDPSAPARQQTYFKALKTIPEVNIHLGTFLTSNKFAGLVHPPDFRPQTNMPTPWPNVVRIVKTEEKGSDVNLASHLLLDAFKGAFDVACVLSNDSDLTEPIKIVTQDFGKKVGLLTPAKFPNQKLKEVSSFVRHIRKNHLTASQFPNPLQLPDGSFLQKPSTWQ
ncbi:NYN domain-containing protein [Candidatus Magnetaquicoccus inordinatus]|uniref:NYN domain-containing protein n=1 Tax=Candidatus Magnetaquicoccus inordinatus TaxID=2496818 RepID=UPI00102D0D74|nr:NYN domain-containing protein [Candidatus Magnetaquicoccus inordinatus]